MKTLCVHSFEEVRRWGPQMEALNRASKKKSPFTSFAFLHTLDPLLTTEPACELWFLLVLQSGVLVGYLALRRVFDRVGPFEVARLELLPAPGGEPSTLVARPGDEAKVSAELYRYLSSRGEEWSVLELRQQHSGSALTPPPVGADLADYYARTRPAEKTSAVALKWPTLAAYFAQMSRKFRQNVRRQVRMLMAQGKVSILSSADPAARQVLFELALIAAARSRKATHSFDRLEQLQALMSHQQAMQLWICVLMLDGRPAAATVCGEYENTLYDLMDLYDGALARAAPGTTLRMVMMRHAISNGYAAVDLGAGNSAYNARWLCDQEDAVDGQLFRKGSVAYWKARLGELRDRLRSSKRPALPVDLSLAPPPDKADQVPEVTAEELTHIQILLARLASLAVDRLSHAELALLMPFGTQKTAPGEPGDPARKVADPIPLGSRMH